MLGGGTQQVSDKPTLFVQLQDRGAQPLFSEQSFILSNLGLELRNYFVNG